MKKTGLLGALAAVLLLLPQPARAEVQGFQVNKLEGVGFLDGKVNKRLEDDYKISYSDCMTYLPDGACSCEGKSCGDNGCGGSCGECQAGFECDASFVCSACVADCEGRVCGSDGCNGSCGECSGDFACNAAGQCEPCTPDCTGKFCGDDGCDGSCGECDVGNACSVDFMCVACECEEEIIECGEDLQGCNCGVCEAGFLCEFGACQACVADCVDKTCGPDGCGGSCGECGPDAYCGLHGVCECLYDGSCSGKCCAEDQVCWLDFCCTPDCMDKECGDDSCGDTCGDCNPGFECLAGVCGCTPVCVEKECGDDGCGGTCGTCDEGEECQDGKCGSKADDITDSSEVPRLLIKWSLDASVYSGWEYSVKVGSCSETGQLDDAVSDACKYIVTKDALPGYTNNEIYVDLRDVIGSECPVGQNGESAIYFFVQDSEKFYEPEVQVLKFTWDYEVPSPPQNVELVAGEENIKVQWDDEVNSGTTEYNVYYSESTFSEETKKADGVTLKDGLTVMSYQITDLTVGATYHVAVSAVDDFGNESELSPVYSEDPIEVDDFWESYKKAGGQEEGGFCFVATAAYGAYSDPAVLLLRDFRDNVLLTGALGRKLVIQYYLHGPVAARFIQGSPALRAAARILLIPAVATAYFTERMSPASRMFVVLLFAVVGMSLVRRRKTVAARAGRVS